MKTTPFWIDSAEIKPFPSLTDDVEVDVIVVGGGITGVTAAYLAKKAGKTVALLERERVGMVDTGSTTAHLTAVTDLRLTEISRSFGKDAARATWDAGAAAIDQIVLNIRREDIDCDFHWLPGYLHASLREPSAEKIEELEAEAKLTREFEIKAELLPAVPLFGVPGIKFNHQAIFNPRKYLRALLASIPGGGSHIFENASADEVSDQPLTVKSGSHKVRGKYLIVATHNPITGNAGTFSAMLFQTKLALYTSYVLSGKVAAGTAAVASYWDTADPYDYLRIEHEGESDRFIFGGEDHKTGQEADTFHPYERLEKRLRAFLPHAKIDHRWSGQVIETTDGLPFIGEITAGQFIATGFAGNGMTFGTLGAMMAVDRLLGRKNPWENLFAPDRKSLLGGLWSYVKENKDYPFYLLRDRLASGEGDSLKQLGKGQGKILKLNGKKVAAFRSSSGEVSLCSPVCTHLKCIVDWNEAEKTWDCPCHGSRFHPTGEVISGPAEEPLEKIKV
jgi:glycine/D-amino acid oxidase-like deaminating enzyme/nitrite reductase/ring-hydroxylating ferredoxin subunit